MSTYRLAIIVGSNRRESINRKLAEAMARLLPANFEVSYPRIDDLPMYNMDLEGERPTAVTRFTDEVRAADAVAVVMPEHNRSLPAVLKNAIDWGSKPMDANVWRGKAASITGTTPGAIGTAVGQQHLRQILGILGAVVQGGEAYIQFKPDLIGADGDFTDPATRAFLQAYVDGFVDLVTRLDKR
ncbi:NADPH-dependent FMN reductase [Luteimonas sp. MC1825]|uniref:NADPH-dependent FMN reductase n=1 Tax=Luteimonas sp. MC1825 TaxID=2761107 RepID=UPI00160F71F1|nr:NADPH-dependent FMN reductase [Luteimonas sp. MC1825]MBB6599518.1 NAD(P)H-dependent oxidoreductase [Luteimonas sp. MC1825]QOC87216.1 NAD(P)H-dependent oxidoreductase [Luteimonas sp. MC1825]